MLHSFFLREWQGRSVWMRLLWPLSGLLGVLLALRRCSYGLSLQRSQSLPVPVIVVGNRIVGGAGKTPTVMALVAHLRQRGHCPGIISRGYGAQGQTTSPPSPLLVTAQHQAADCGDEPLLLWRRCQVPVAVAPDRVAAAQALLRAHPDTDVLISDDGLQHWPLARDLDILVFDQRGAGNGWLLPAGPLREPLHAHSMARSQPPLVLYTHGAPSTPLPGYRGQRQLKRLVPLAAWWRGQSDHTDLSALAHASAVWAAAGIAQPARFFDMLRAAGLTIQTCPLPDHSPWAQLPWPSTAQHALITEKDAVKLTPERVARDCPHTQVWVATLDFEPEARFWDALDQALSPLWPSHSCPPNHHGQSIT